MKPCGAGYPATAERGAPTSLVRQRNICTCSRLFRLVTGRGEPSSVALARDVNTILDAVIFKRGKARGYFAIPKHFAIACVGASVAIAFLNDLDAIFLAFQSQREQKRYRYLRGGNAFVSYNASVRLICYDVRRRR